MDFKVIVARFLVMALLYSISQGCRGVATEGTAPSSVQSESSCETIYTSLRSLADIPRMLSKAEIEHMTADIQTEDSFKRCLSFRAHDLALKLSDPIEESMNVSREYRIVGILAARSRQIDLLQIYVDNIDKFGWKAGLSMANFPSYDPLVEFGDLAVQALKDAYCPGSDLRQTLIVNVLKDIGSQKSVSVAKVLVGKKNQCGQ